MLLGGLQKTTLIDFPGRIACTVFTVGCNFRCPFCHNKDLVTLKNFEQKKLPQIPEKDFFTFLNKRKGILDGVCITGGEPTLQNDLPDFCKKIKDMGFEVKLDSNGTNPKMLSKMINKKVVDFIAMDLKNNFSDYNKAVGINYPIDNIKKSIKLILQSDIEHEFRTTVVPGIHKKQNLLELAKELNSLYNQYGEEKEKVWFLQKFRPQNCLKDQYNKKKPLADKKFSEFKKEIETFFPEVKLKGIK